MRRVFFGMGLVVIGAFSGLMLWLVSMDQASRAERMALLIERGATTAAQTVDLGPVRSNDRRRGVRYTFDAGGIIEGSDSLPSAELRAVLDAGPPEIRYLPERPDVNALAWNVAQWEANDGTDPRAQPWQMRIALTFAGLSMVLGLALIFRRRGKAA